MDTPTAYEINQQIDLIQSTLRNLDREENQLLTATQKQTRLTTNAPKRAFFNVATPFYKK